MSMYERISLKRKITEIALNEAIRGWESPVSGQLNCPFCQSEHIYQRMRRKNGMTHGCRACEKLFSLELVPQCRCIRPGKFAKCLSCPQYQRIRELMKFNIEQLRYLSEAEVNQIINHPDFYKSDFSLQQLLPRVRLKHYAERQKLEHSRVTDHVSDGSSDNTNSQQLSLFEQQV